MKKQLITRLVAGFIILGLGRVLSAENWPGFRGPGAAGISAEKDLPATWSDTENLKWKVKLPGPGSSSPIVWDDKVFVTCWSDYGMDRNNPGRIEDLKRHLICVSRDDGKVIWDQAVPADQPEDPYRGNLTEHGYASSTPITDGNAVYVFFGKTGALAFDMNGKKLWQKNLGRESSNMRWGSGPSPILYKNLVIVNAAEESVTLFGLDKKTGDEVWKVQTGKLEMTYATPAIVKLDGGREELVIAVPGEIWGFEPEKGQYLWHANTSLARNISPSVVAENGICYAMGGMPGSAAAVRAGGKNDVTDSHSLWSSRDGSYVPSGVIKDGRFYCVNDRADAFCLEAKTGKQIYKQKLPVQGNRAFYASVVLADGKLYAVSRGEGCFVLTAGPEFKVIAQNRFASDPSQCNAGPAISSGRIFLRSDQYLYCIGK